MQNLKGLYYIYDKVGDIAFSVPNVYQNDLVAVGAFKSYLEKSSDDSLQQPEFFELRRICSIDDKMNVVDYCQIPICEGTEVKEVFDRLLRELKLKSEE